MAFAPSSRLAVTAPAARAALSSACIGIALLAMAMHAPGHTTVDSSIQLHEAFSGRITSWAPPFMSALLYWLGLGSIATSLFVALNTAATYGAMRLAAGGPDTRWPLWRLALALVVIANPVVFAYVGIVWKDVLLASLCTLALGLSIVAWRSRGAARVVLAALAIAVLVPIPLVRQQGFVMLPIFAISPVYLVVTAGWRTQRAQWLAGALAVLALPLGYLGVRAAVEASFARNADGSIHAAAGDDVSVGTRLIKLYDIAGIEARTGSGPLARAGASTEQLAELDRLYTPTRIDTLGGPLIDPMLAPLKGDSQAIDRMWRSAIAESPSAYMAHRWDAFAWLTGLHGPERCLPVHVGVDGIPEYLAESGLRVEQDARDQRLFRALQPWIASPVWRHWAYVLLGVLLAIVAWRRGREARWALLPWVAGLAAFTAGFLPTSIACDFRYLYTLVPCAGALALAMLSPMRSPAAATSAQAD